MVGTEQTKYYHGHMFNIVFHDAAATYYHLQDIQDFWGGWPNPNQLLKYIVFDVKEKV